MKNLDKFNKWSFRSNARRKTLFGVEEPITYGEVELRAGISGRRHYAIHNPAVARTMAKDNLEVLKLMRTEKYQLHCLEMRKQAVEFYKKIRSAK
jgi:hypothetical protein